MEHPVEADSTPNPAAAADVRLRRCRCCLQITNTKRPLEKVNKQTSLSYREMIENCLSVTVTTSSTMPSYVCLHCSNQLQSYYKFKKTYIENNNYLLKNFESKIKLEIEKKYIESRFVDETEIDLKEEKMIEVEIENIKAESECLHVRASDVQAELKIKLECDNEKGYIHNNETLESNNEYNYAETESTQLYPKIHELCTDEKFICDYCDEVFRQKNKLCNHIQSHIEGQKPKVKKEPNFICDICGKKYYCHALMKEHMDCVHFGIKNICELCNKPYTSKSVHKYYYHGKGRQCHHCGMWLPSVAEYKSHIYYKHSNTSGKTRHKCKKCDETFESYQTRNEHIFEVHQGRKYTCQQCPKIFTRKDKLTRHLRLHSDEKPYECDVCQKAFKTRGNLTVHKLRHASVKSYKCDCCDRKFRSTEALWRHKNHSDVRPKHYKCDHCEKVFKYTQSRNRHTRSVHQRQRFICQFCSKDFTTKEKLSRHITVHSNEKPYKCDVCQKSFNRNDNLKKHKEQHSDMKKKY